MGGPDMFCSKDRGGCGKLLEWDDGAFCKECMTKALHQRLKRLGVVERNDPFRTEETRTYLGDSLDDLDEMAGGE